MATSGRTGSWLPVILDLGACGACSLRVMPGLSCRRAEDWRERGCGLVDGVVVGRDGRKRASNRGGMVAEKLISPVDHDGAPFEFNAAPSAVQSQSTWICAAFSSLPIHSLDRSLPRRCTPYIPRLRLENPMDSLSSRADRSKSSAASVRPGMRHQWQITLRGCAYAALCKKGCLVGSRHDQS